MDVLRYLRRIVATSFTDRILEDDMENELKVYLIAGSIPQGSVLSNLL